MKLIKVKETKVWAGRYTSVGKGVAQVHEVIREIGERGERVG